VNPQADPYGRAGSRRRGSGFAILALTLTSLLLFLHLVQLDDLPAGFYIDESALAYNAWSIALTGADEYGTPCPLFFRSFGNYHDPAMVYLLAPLLKLGGPEKWLARAPAAVLHVLAALAFALLAHEHVRNRYLALAGAAVFGLLPWGFALSRSVMAGYMPMLLGMNLGWWALLRSMRLGSPRLAGLSALAWAFAMYAHSIGRPMTAVLLVCFVLSFNRGLLDRWRCFAVFCATYLVALVPMMIAVLDSPALTERFAILSVWRDSPGTIIVLERIAIRYAEYFSPEYLFITGDGNLRHHTRLRGELYLFLIPFLLAGLYQTVRAFARSPESRLLLLALLTYPVAAALTISHMHSTRSLNGAPVWCLLAVVGLSFLWSVGPWVRRGLAVFGIFALVEVGEYLADYFGPYAQRSRPAFDAYLTESLEHACDQLRSDETLYISQSMFSRSVDEDFRPIFYAHVLFFCKIPPAIYQERGLPPERVQRYAGRADGSGLLLRSKFLFAQVSPTESVAVPNPEPVPEGARLIRELPERENVFQLLRFE
jgi:hypothetical protein